ncbi:hypothetical protein JX265_013366 [Neoarthrinium moseri]|uniref:Ankyrin repeat protein n=1 Tax=Neoarthrinium moseri TaxID=1658444 RepID=A0A9P9W8R0_9PEZI|nr:uncharacterized protein JN550_012198 [Neoarthrinium moseri]KAI1850803.1 hypothetical protein JX265_013366 [Neoarthrinium moseri]KAI1859185.1 hypothetical protein JN550_012198 [Neoarthrinium moseri]
MSSAKSAPSADMETPGEARPTPCSDDTRLPNARVGDGASIPSADSERMEFDVKAYQRSLQHAIREKRFKDASVDHRKIIQLRIDLSPHLPFPVADMLDAYTLQAVLLLICHDVDEHDRSIFRQAMNHLSSQRLASESWGLLCARVGAIFMRSSDKDDLEQAKKYLNWSLEGLVRAKPLPLDHLLSISQRLADLHDFSKDTARAEGLVQWLKTTTGSTAFQDVQVGRMSKALEWCKKEGLTGERFDTKDQTKGASALEHAIGQNEYEQLESMLIFTEQTSPPSNLVSELLLTAADTRNARIATLLFEHNATVDTVDTEGRTVLHRCQHCPSLGNKGGHDIAAMFLFQPQSFDLINKQDRAGKTALYMACEEGYAEMVTLLLNHGARSNTAEINGKTALYLACERGDRRIVERLLRADDLEINARGPGGLTPLMVAVKFAAAHAHAAKGIGMVEELLRKGADPTMEDNNKKSALHYVGGVWRDDLKHALKIGNLNTTGASSGTTAVPIVKSSDAASSQTRVLETGGRSPSLRTLSFSRQFWPTRVVGSTSSLATSARFSKSIFSKASGSSSSRRTSITTPSQAPDMTDQLVAPDDVADASSSRIAISSAKGPGHRPTMKARHPSDDSIDVAPEDRIASRRPNSISSGVGRPVGPADQAESIRQIEPGQMLSNLDIRDTQRSAGDQQEDAESDHQSTEYDFDTPLDTSEDSYSGDDGPSYSNLSPTSNPHRGHPGGQQSHPGAPYSGGSWMLSQSQTQNGPQHTPSDQSGNGQSPDESQGSGDFSVADQGQEGSEEKRRPMFACPFAKKDPVGYDHCHKHKYKLTEIKHVKQHLARRHLIWDCPRCRQGFRTKGLYDQHLRESVCEVISRDPPEGMTLEQQPQLSRRSNSRLSPEDQWFAIWDILFPGRPRPMSPYQDDFINITDHNNYLQEFLGSRMPEIVQGEFQELGNPTHIGYDQVLHVVGRIMRRFADGLSQGDNATRHNSGPPSSHAGDGNGNLRDIPELAEIGPSSQGTMQRSDIPPPDSGTDATMMQVDDAYMHPHTFPLHSIEEGSSPYSQGRPQAPFDTSPSYGETGEQIRLDSSVTPAGFGMNFDLPVYNHTPSLSQEVFPSNMSGFSGDWAMEAIANQPHPTNHLFQPDPRFVEDFFAQISNLNQDMSGGRSQVDLNRFYPYSSE